ncbi:GNAT family N-acetyltransferase [Nocardia goodfellowii]|uniref:Acetyltransferase n=1 Tax=Nocardia goodfellowii TaxID=882446 RepID=A0ABS4QFB9_9NOCA|nr:GNAT family N-acetyltransferase [Nocardia goodfellowii]MBP2190383.1 putative acetyltransferase [Nocardia goodfellowii]
MSSHSPLRISVDDLSGPDIAALLTQHLADMYANSPEDSVHALDLDELRKPEITFWAARAGDTLVGCTALKELDPTHGEIKSMRTATGHTGRGIAAALLTHLIAEARTRGYTRLSLETGTADFFAPRPAPLPAPRLRTVRSLRRLHRRPPQHLPDPHPLNCANPVAAQADL